MLSPEDKDVAGMTDKPDLAAAGESADCCEKRTEQIML
jgi:hypothetical protein